MVLDVAYIDMEKSARAILEDRFNSSYRFQTFADPLACLHAFEANPFPVVLAKSNLQPISGIQFLKRVEKLSPSTVKILVTNGKPPLTMESHSFPEIPLGNSQLNMDWLIKQIDGICQNYPSNGRHTDQAPEIVGVSSELRSQLEYAEKIANFDEPVLITGETGTGKDLIAKYVYYKGDRCHQPLQIVNCAAINPELFESEFFGHVKGAFTGATLEHKGHFLRAHKGTLVLDEISELGLRFQAKLLRAIENQEIYPVGAEKVVKLDTRILALSNRNLSEEIKKGHFRADLYHRLNKYRLHLPALRERLEDIRPLTEYFLKSSRVSLLPEWQKYIDPQIYAFMSQLDFPGNVRDLQNLILKVVSHKTPGNYTLSRSDFEKAIGKELNGKTTLRARENLAEYLMQQERSRIIQELNKNKYNISETARRLGISRQSLQQRLRRLKVEVCAS